MHDIKSVGEYEATIHFYKGVEVKLPVKVVAENKEAVAPVVEEKPAEEAPVEETQEMIDEKEVLEDIASAE